MRFLKGLFKFVLVIVIICAIIVGVSYFTTPTTFGIDDVEVMGYSFSSLGLEKTTFFDIASLLRKAVAPTEASTYVENESVVTTADYEEVLGVFEEEESLAGTEEKIDLSKILDGELIFGEEKTLTLEGGELTALLNLSILHSIGDFDIPIEYGENVAKASDVSLYANEDVGLTDLNELKAKLVDFENLSESEKAYVNEAIKALLISTKQNGLTIKAIENKVENDGIIMTVVLELDIASEILTELKGSPLENVINTKNYIVVKNKYEISNDRLKHVDSTSDAFLFNRLSQSEIEQILTTVGKASDLNVDAKQTVEDTSLLTAEIFEKLINNLGKISITESGDFSITTRT